MELQYFPAKQKYTPSFYIKLQGTNKVWKYKSDK